MITDKATPIKLNQDARKAILKGVNRVYDAVKLTLGPEGGNAMLYRTYNRGPRITNDGVTIAKVIEPKDEFERLASTAFREAAEKTNSKAGDGTTTTVVIAGKLINDIFGKASQGASQIGGAGSGFGVMKIRKQLLDEAKIVVDKVKEKAQKTDTLEKLEHIGVISVENEAIGKTVAKMAWEVGVDGFIDVVEGYKGEIETEVMQGMRIPAKVPAKAFVTNPQRFEMMGEDLDVLVTNYKLDNVNQTAQAINGLLKNHPKLAIFAPEFGNDVLMDLFNAMYAIQNGVKVKKSGLDIYPVAVPSLRTEQFEDLAIYTGATFINKDVGKKLLNITESDLGFAGKIVIKDSEAKEDGTVIKGGGAHEEMVKVGNKDLPTVSAVSQRIAMLKEQIAETKVEIHKKMLERRIASMGSAVGIIRVGSSSDADAGYLKLKIEDAVYACKAALEEGHVRGGGLCLKEIAEGMPEDSLLVPALKAPYEQIQENADGKFEIGDDILDPAKVVRLAVEHAVSVAAQLITTKIMVPEEDPRRAEHGSELIAKAILAYVKIIAREKGLYRENQDEMDIDNLRLSEEKLMEGND